MEAEAYSSMAKSSGYTEEPPVSWFRYEELVDDWVTITTVEAPKRGPLLKSRLTGDAYMYKAVLQNDLLQDPDEGVNYFKKTLKTYFLKGATNVYLYRLLQFLQSQKAERRVPHFHIQIRTPSHEIEGSMDGLDARLHGTVPIISTVRHSPHTRAPPPVLLNEDDPTVLRQYITGMQDRQQDAFPFGDNLIAQFFIIQSELSVPCH